MCHGQEYVCVISVQAILLSSFGLPPLSFPTPSPAELLPIWQGILWSLTAPASADPKCYSWREILVGLQLYSYISEDLVTKRKHPGKYEKINLTTCLGIPPSVAYVRQKQHAVNSVTLLPPLFKITFEYVEVLFMST